MLEGRGVFHNLPTFINFVNLRQRYFAPKIRRVVLSNLQFTLTIYLILLLTFHYLIIFLHYFLIFFILLILILILFLNFIILLWLILNLLSVDYFINVLQVLEVSLFDAGGLFTDIFNYVINLFLLLVLFNNKGLIIILRAWLLLLYVFTKFFINLAANLLDMIKKIRPSNFNAGLVHLLPDFILQKQALKLLRIWLNLIFIYRTLRVRIIIWLTIVAKNLLNPSVLAIWFLTLLSFKLLQSPFLRFNIAHIFFKGLVFLSKIHLNLIFKYLLRFH